MPTSFTVRLDDKDWNSGIGGWNCSALGIPGVEIGNAYSGGTVVDPAAYQVDIGNRIIRWPSTSRPTSLVIEILLEKGLTTSTASAWLTAVVSVLTALISATATYYAARGNVSPVVDAKTSVEAAHKLIPCSERKDWPKGTWLNWGRFDNYPTPKETNNGKRIPQIWPVAEFGVDQHYDSETEQLSDNREKNKYTAHLEATSDPMKPGATVHFHGSDHTGYEMWETLKITGDGCMMDGSWKDTDGNFGVDGSYHYLYQAGRYFVPAE